MVCYQTRVFVIAIVTGECTVLLLQKYILKVCAVLFGFRSSCLKVHIHLRYINTQQQTITSFYLWLPFSRVSLICWYYENTVLRFVWYRLVFIQIIIKFISIYPTSTHRYEHHQHLISLMSYQIATEKCRDCIRGQTIIVRDIVTPI